MFRHYSMYQSSLPVTWLISVLCNMIIELRRVVIAYAQTCSRWRSAVKFVLLTSIWSDFKLPKARYTIQKVAD